MMQFTKWKVSKYGDFSGQNTGKDGPEKNPYLDTFQAMISNKLLHQVKSRTWQKTGNSYNGVIECNHNSPVLVFFSLYFSIYFFNVILFLFHVVHQTIACTLCFVLRNIFFAFLWKHKFRWVLVLGNRMVFNKKSRKINCLKGNCFVVNKLLTKVFHLTWYCYVCSKQMTVGT